MVSLSNLLGKIEYHLANDYWISKSVNPSDAKNVPFLPSS